MVRGNWQKRVETAQERRKETRQRKAAKESRGHYKAIVQKQLWPLLDKYNDNILSSTIGCSGDGQLNKYMLNIWTDTTPQHVQKRNIDYQDSSDDDKHQHRKQKVPSKPKPKHGGGCNNRKKSFDDTPKKAHPRSHSSPPSNPKSPYTNSGSDQTDSILLSRKFFFFGESSSKKNSNYPSQQIMKGQKTLADVLLSKRIKKTIRNEVRDAQDNNQQLQDLQSSYEAVANSSLHGDDETDDKLMDNDVSDRMMNMVYYLQVPLPSTKISSTSDKVDDNTTVNSVTDLLSSALVEEKCSIGSIVYLVFNQRLIFDRHQGGVIVSADDEQTIFGKTDDKVLNPSVDDKDIDRVAMFDSLPIAALGHALLFLPNESVGVLQMVCKQWHEEIKASSIGLYKDLILRNGWPIENEEETMGEGETSVVARMDQNFYKNIFISHYDVLKNIVICQEGAQQLFGRNGNHDGSKVCIHRKDDTHGTCRRIRSWNESSSIFAFEDDCTIQIFETTLANDSIDGRELVCKLMIRVRVAPIRKSKKNHCKLVSMDIDDTYVACSFHTHNSNELDCSAWITAVNRDDLLSYSQEEELDDEVLQRFDIGDHLKDFIHNNEQYYSDLNENLPIGEDFDLSVWVKHIEACGEGLFAVPIVLKVSRIDLGIENEDKEALVLFSVVESTIVWLTFMSGIESISSLSLYRQRVRTEIICAFLHSPKLLRISVERNNSVSSTLITDKVVASYNKMITDNWNGELSIRKCCVTKSYIILADVYQSISDLDGISYKTVLSFVPISNESDNISTLTLDGQYSSVHSIHQAGNNHIILLCHYCDATNMTYTAYFVVVYIPSKREIFSCALLSGFMEPVVVNYGSLVSMCLNEIGLVMTGHAIRSLKPQEASINDDVHMLQTKKSKKKKRQKGKSGKKDGYARGMSVRG